MKVAQQAQLGHDGNVDVRLALLDNPSPDGRLRSRVASSFSSSDLAAAESDLEYAEKKSMRLYAEYGAALEKSIDAHGGIFPSSEEKIERMNQAADRKQIKIDLVDREINVLEEQCKRLKKLVGSLA